MNERTFIWALRLLPKNALSRVAGWFTRRALPGVLLRPAMRRFAARYGVDLSECDDLRSFATFGQFFARPLKSGRRPIAPGDDVVVSPADGCVSEMGLATNGRLIQAKGHDFTLGDLLGDPALAGRFAEGTWITIYLSPRDYHRIHYPVPGKVVGYRYVPGRLWPVNPISVRNVPRLFCVNERLVTLLDGPLGPCAVVAVGATIVGRVRAYYDPNVPLTNLRGGHPISHDYAEPIGIEKGAQMGAFEMGSTVILLFERGRVGLLPDVQSGACVRVGAPIGGPASEVQRLASRPCSG
jgi:phosphatidylserine decarboxylase